MRREYKVTVMKRRLRLGLAWAALLVSAASMPVTAQTIELPSGSVNLRDLQQQYGQRQQDGSVPSTLDNARQRAQLEGQRSVGSPFDSRMDEAGYGRNLETPSSLEVQYQHRTRDKLRQFGYDIGNGAATASSAGLLSGAVPDDYVLGIGDELVVTLRGQVNNTVQARVDREGRIVLPNMSPVAAAGRRFGEFREDLTAQAQAAFLQTNVFVSVGSVRSIGVLVTGEVQEPGRLTLTSFSSLIDALAMAKGIAKTGSLRTIKIVRGGETLVIDLYDVLLGRRSAMDLRLRDGDQIIVPAIGDTIAIKGDVVRPGIYELRAGDGRASVEAALALAGGPQRARGNRLEILRLDKDGRNQVIRNASPSLAVSASDVIVVELPRDAVALEGAAELPGDRGLSQVQTLRDLLRDPYVLQSNPYLPLAVIDTEDPLTRQRRYVAVDLRRVLDGSMNVTLRERDRVIILTREDVRYLTSSDVQAVLRGEAPPSLRLSVDSLIAAEKLTLAGQAPQAGVDNQVGAMAGRRSAAQEIPKGAEYFSERPYFEEANEEKGRTAPQRKGMIGTVKGGQQQEDRLVESDVKCRGLERLASMAAEGSYRRFAVAQLFSDLGTTRRQENRNAVVNVQACPKLFDRHSDLLPFLLEHASAVQGEVRQPGVYPVVPGANAEEVIGAAGGITLDGDSGAIEISGRDGSRRSAVQVQQLAQTAVNPGDVIRVFNEVARREVGVVEVAGEIAYPGRYDIRRGERLSELLRRVGGLTPDAYPYGAVFQRDQARRTEEEGFRRGARELEQSLPALLLNTENAQNAQGSVQFIQSMIAELRNTPGVGRVVIESDPTVLAARPELDLTLEPGDRLVIPKRPSHVTVTGEVLNPSSVMFTSGMTAREYIRKAGGFSASSERSDAFVIFPNGESEPLRLGTFSDGNVPIPPGSTIVVPRDPAPFSFLATTRSVASLFSSLALSVASLVVISNN